MIRAVPLAGGLRRWAIFVLVAGLWTAPTSAEKRCPDGVHHEIDLSELAIEYQAHSFSATLSSLSFLGSRLGVEPKTIQKAEAATQVWNEYLKGLVAGYNSCAITKQQYAEGLQKIYPRLKEDAAGLEEIRQLISDGKQADEKRLRRLLESYLGNVQRFAEISNQEIWLERIEARLAVVSTKTDEIKGHAERTERTTTQVLREVKEIRERLENLATPAEVKEEISELRAALLSKVDEAEEAYDKGYELLQAFRFAEAIPHLERALENVKLPDFYRALGEAFLEMPDLRQAERVCRDGLRHVGEAGDEHEAQLANLLGRILQDQGDLAGALEWTKRALAIDEKVYGPEHPVVAIRANNIGQILQAQGDLAGALEWTKRALAIREKVYGPEHPKVAIRANNIGRILQAQGDLAGALEWTKRALAIFGTAYGPNNPSTRIVARNLEAIKEAMK